MIALARRILIFKSAYWVNVWGNCTRPVVFRLFLSTLSGSSGPRVNSVRLGFRNDEQTFFGGIEENVRIVLFFFAVHFDGWHLAGGRCHEEFLFCSLAAAGTVPAVPLFCRLCALDILSASW